MTEYEMQMKSMTADDVLGDALINSEAQDYLWDIFTNSDDCYKLFMKMMAEGHDLTTPITNNPFISMVDNAKLSSDILHEV